MSMALPGYIRSAFCILNDARWSIVAEGLTYALGCAGGYRVTEIQHTA